MFWLSKTSSRNGRLHSLCQPDQKASRIANLLVQEVIPLFGVPECLLSDRGTNLLSHLMHDICHILGIKKLNTTAHHPQCDGMVVRFNRTIKTMLCKHAATFGLQLNQHLLGALWNYRNVPHDSTGEKPSFLLLGIDCHTPTEAVLLPPNELEITEVTDYREEMGEYVSTQTLVIHHWAGPSVIAHLAPDSTPDRAE